MIDTNGIRNALDLGVHHGPGDNVGHLADICRELCVALDEARGDLSAARTELEAFAKTPIPADTTNALALVHVTAPFIERMRAALGAE